MKKKEFKVLKSFFFSWLIDVKFNFQAFPLYNIFFFFFLLKMSKRGKKRSLIHICEPTVIYFFMTLHNIDFDSFEGSEVPMYNTYGSYNCTCFMLASTRNVKCHGQPGASCSMNCSSLVCISTLSSYLNFHLSQELLPLSEQKSSQLTALHWVLYNNLMVIVFCCYAW